MKDLSESRRLFFRHVAQTSPSPLGLEIDKAEGVYLYDTSGKAYLDLIGGISVANTGHRHPAVIQAIRDQLDRYLHVMVYGELIQSPQVQYATTLAANLPPSLNTIYFTNSGAEAAEGAMKLAKRVTGRTEIVAFQKSYHGSTQGALSIIGDEYWRNAFRPLLPGILHEEYNSAAALDAISTNTACVFAETIQAESGVHAPDPGWVWPDRLRMGLFPVRYRPRYPAAWQGAGRRLTPGCLHFRPHADDCADRSAGIGPYHHFWRPPRLLCGGPGFFSAAFATGLDRGGSRKRAAFPTTAGTPGHSGGAKLRPAHRCGVRKFRREQANHRRVYPERRTDGLVPFCSGMSAYRAAADDH